MSLVFIFDYLEIKMLKLILLISIFRVCTLTCIDHSSDCQYSFGDWSECDPCTSKKSRPVDVSAPSTLSGASCPNSYTEVEPCNSTIVCSQSSSCGMAEFYCSITSRCVNNALLCNGADDCGDFSDEADCNNKTYARRGPPVEIEDFPFSDLL